jgi:hypothetical protein
MESCFPLSSERRVHSMKKEEIDLQNVQLLSEKCRIALEKSYGFKVPLPKSLAKSAKKEPGFWVKCNV